VDKLSEDIIKIILSKLDRIEDKQDKTMEKVAASEALEREKEKRCDIHGEQMANHESRIVALETKQVSQEATSKTNNDWIARLLSIGSIVVMIIKEFIAHWK
jgi:hypothetical protein